MHCERKADNSFSVLHLDDTDFLY